MFSNYTTCLPSWSSYIKYVGVPMIAQIYLKGLQQPLMLTQSHILTIKTKHSEVSSVYQYYLVSVSVRSILSKCCWQCVSNTVRAFNLEFEISTACAWDQTTWAKCGYLRWTSRPAESSRKCSWLSWTGLGDTNISALWRCCLCLEGWEKECPKQLSTSSCRRFGWMKLISMICSCASLGDIVYNTTDYLTSHSAFIKSKIAKRYFCR